MPPPPVDSSPVKYIEDHKKEWKDTQEYEISPAEPVWSVHSPMMLPPPSATTAAIGHSSRVTHTSIVVVLFPFYLNETLSK